MKVVHIFKYSTANYNKATKVVPAIAFNKVFHNRQSGPHF